MEKKIESVIDAKLARVQKLSKEFDTIERKMLTEAEFIAEEVAAGRTPLAFNVEGYRNYKEELERVRTIYYKAADELADEI